MKRKILVLMIACVTALSFTACGSSESTSSNTSQQQEEKEYVDDINAIATNPDSYKGKYVKFYGIVFNVETNDDYYGCQVYVDTDYNQNVLLQIPKSAISEAPKSDDFLSIDAKVEGSRDGETLMGVETTWAYLVADSAEKTTYTESFGKADTTWEFSDMSIEQHGLRVDITKVEFAKDETRIYITATNNSSDNMSLWTSSAKVIQNGQQYEQTYGIVYEDSHDISSDILPGASSSGVIYFDPLSASEFTLYLEGYSDNWEIDLEPFTFNLAQ